MNWITFRFVIFYCDYMFEWVIFHHFFFLSKIYISLSLLLPYILCMRVYDSVSMGLGFSVSNDNNDYIKSIAKFGVVVENRFPRIHFFFFYYFTSYVTAYRYVHYVNLKLKKKLQRSQITKKKEKRAAMNSMIHVWLKILLNAIFFDCVYFCWARFHFCFFAARKYSTFFFCASYAKTRTHNSDKKKHKQKIVS